MKTLATLLYVPDVSFIYWTDWLKFTQRAKKKGQQELNALLLKSWSHQEPYPASDCKWKSCNVTKESWIEQCIREASPFFFLLNASASALPVTLFLIKYLCYWWIRVEFLCFATFASQADNILPWKYRPFLTAHFKERAWHYAMLWLLASLYHPFRVVCSATTFQGISFGAWHCETREIMFGNNMGWWQDMSNSWNYRRPFTSCPLPPNHCWWLDLLVPPPSLHKGDKSRGVSREPSTLCEVCKTSLSGSLAAQIVMYDEVK